MKATPAQLISMIRFHLSEMRNRNAHHEFEHLSRHLARARVYSNVIPATGPVGAGGDRGRDFETFNSEIDWPVTVGADFWAFSSAGRKVAFGCSLQSDIDPKIRQDLETIIAGGAVDEVVYFCEANVPIPRRHKLQDWVRSKGVDLQIFDGAAISELLSSRDTFWIAQEYLKLPAELMPSVIESADWYSDLKRRWQNRVPLEVSESDFMEIKEGIRHATFNLEARCDLSRWMELTEKFLGSPAPRYLQRAAEYEISVAAFRGRGEMSEKIDLVRDYYSDIFEFVAAVDLQSAATLLLYSFSALATKSLTIDPQQLFDWRRQVVGILDEQLKDALGAGRLSELLRVRGYAELIPSEARITSDLVSAIGFWRRMYAEAQKAPLFPIEDFADFLTSIVDHVGSDSEFLEFASQVDELVSVRAGAAAAGEKALGRAQALINKGHNLSAIAELHRVKKKWFSGERIYGAVRTLIFLSDSYRNLGLAYAAKYYALAAAFISEHQDGEVSKLVPEALLEAVSAEDAAGNSFGVMHLTLISTAAAFRLGRNPLEDLKEGTLNTDMGQLAALLGFLRRGNPDASTTVELAFEKWPNFIRAPILQAAADPNGFWNQGTWLEAWTKLDDAIADRPFGDLGAEREVGWRALGVRWFVRFDNIYRAVPIAEQFIAELQLALCAVAQIELGLLPVDVHVELGVADGLDEPQWGCENKDGCCVFTVTMPEVVSDHCDFSSLEIITMILRSCSVLSGDAFFDSLGLCIRQLPEQIFVGRPYSELYRNFVPAEFFHEDLRCRAGKFCPEVQFSHKEMPELAWRDGLGPTYSTQKAIDAIRLRYMKLAKYVGLTVRRLSKNERTFSILRSMRDKGMKDWEILSIIGNIALGLRFCLEDAEEVDADLLQRSQASFDDEETEEAVLDVELFTEKRFLGYEAAFTGAFLAGWGLEGHHRPFDLVALKRFLAVRYRMQEDDLLHDDVFGWGSE